MAFNKLPQNIRKMSDNVNILKSMLKSFLEASAFYLLDEKISASIGSN
jgi:hypothetical protein